MGLKIVFAGTPTFGLSCLEALNASSHQLIALYTQPDRPAGRGRKLEASAVKSWGIVHDLPVYQPVNFKEPGAVEALQQLQPDVMVVIAYGLLLPPVVLAIPRLGCINVHASLLPRWRGASPIQQAILQGDKTTGVTIMKMDKGLDTGDKLAEAACAIEPTETAGQLHDKLALLAVRPLLDTLDQLAAGLVKPEPQQHDKATYAGKILKEQALIDWHQPAEKIDQAIRAYSPWPIAYTTFNQTVLRVYQAQVEPGSCDALPGTVLAIERQGLLVATLSGRIRIQTLQFPGKKPINVAEWMNGHHDQITPGTVFK